MEKSSSRKFTLRRVPANHENEILTFHSTYLTEHLFPRDLKYFKQLIEDRCLYAATECLPNGENKLIGICYIALGLENDGQTERNEFGGIFILDAYRGSGIASALGVLSISQHYLFDPPLGRMIAHVHSENTLPLNLLKKQLGFEHIGSETVRAEEAPRSMAKNKNGEVVGLLFQFEKRHLKKFAAWLSGFDGTITGKDQATNNLTVNLLLMDDIQRSITSLIALSAEK